MKILIAPNSFKECADSIDISELIYQNLKSKINQDFIQRPISDGGDGFTEVCEYYFKGNKLSYNISEPYGNSSFECNILYSEEKRTVYIESANILGIKIIPAEFRNPLLLSSRGLGEILKHLDKEIFPIEEVIIGIGGTGTIDMGLGACSVYGFSLFDNRLKRIEVIPENYTKAESVEWEESKLSFKIKLVVDVDNPLVGEKGAIRVFGKQKGADEIKMKVLETGFNYILNLLKNKELYNPSYPLSGAGGGIPAGFHILFNSINLPAKDFILDELDLQKQIEAADLLITGEGSFDSQSIMGKGAGIIVNEALKLRKDVILICGRVEEKLKSSFGKNLTYFELQSYFKNTEDSIKNYKWGIEKACEEIAGLIK